MPKNPERIAWILLWLAFFTFCVCAISIPASIRWYLFNSMTTFPTELTAIRGTVLAKYNQEEQSIPITRDHIQNLDEQTTITTDDTSQAILNFFNGSTITLYNNTILILNQVKRPTFEISPLSDYISVEIVKGRIRVNPVITETDNIFEVQMPQAQAILHSGSYAIEVNNEQAQLTTRFGKANVMAQKETVIVDENKLTTIINNHPPSAVTDAEQNLVINGKFNSPMEANWEPQIFVPSNNVTSTVQVVRVDGRSVVEFSSEGEDNIHTESSIKQIIDKDVRDFQVLRISADIRLNFQSLPGGGQIGTEFPLMIQLAYRDVDGNDRNWFHGFYYSPPPDNYILYNEQNNTNENITRFVWYPYESKNLLAVLGVVKPVYIKYIRLYASGWIYNAMVTDVQLLAKD